MTNKDPHNMYPTPVLNLQNSDNKMMYIFNCTMMMMMMMMMTLHQLHDETGDKELGYDGRRQDVDTSNNA
jgi:hypothetical protein